METIPKSAIDNYFVRCTTQGCKLSMTTSFPINAKNELERHAKDYPDHKPEVTISYRKFEVITPEQLAQYVQGK